MKDFIINSKTDLINAINEFGFLPFFANSIEGFSIEEHITRDCWYDSDDGVWNAWEWKGPVIRESRYDDGLANYRDKTLYELVDFNAPIISKRLKQLGNYKKGGNKGFDTIITRLQSQCYVIISDFVYMKDKFGRPYGWGVAEYSTPERFMGNSFSERVYEKQPQESYEIILEHFSKLFPDEDLKKLKKFIG